MHALCCRGIYAGGIAALLADFDRYLDQEHIDLRRDGTAYRMACIWMTDEELNELARGFLSLLQPYGQPGHVGPEAADPPHHRASGTRFHPDRRPEQQLTVRNLLRYIQLRADRQIPHPERVQPRTRTVIPWTFNFW